MFYTKNSHAKHSLNFVLKKKRIHPFLTVCMEPGVKMNSETQYILWLKNEEQCLTSNNSEGLFKF